MIMDEAAAPRPMSPLAPTGSAAAAVQIHGTHSDGLPDGKTAGYHASSAGSVATCGFSVWRGIGSMAKPSVDAARVGKYKCGRCSQRCGC